MEVPCVYEFKEEARTSQNARANCGILTTTFHSEVKIDQIQREKRREKSKEDVTIEINLRL